MKLVGINLPAYVRDDVYVSGIRLKKNETNWFRPSELSRHIEDVIKMENTLGIQVATKTIEDSSALKRIGVKLLRQDHNNGFMAHNKKLTNQVQWFTPQELANDLESLTRLSSKGIVSLVIEDDPALIKLNSSLDLRLTGVRPPEPPLFSNGVERVLSLEASTYIVVGDSTRHNSYNGMIDYYTSQFAKIGTTVVRQAESGLEMQEWYDNTRTSSRNATIAAIPNTGVSTVVEFSLGWNDLGGITKDALRDLIVASITSIREARPSVAIVLVTPFSLTRLDVQEAYAEAAAILKPDVFLDGRDAMRYVHENNLTSDFYQDSVHPNANGSMRVVNWIADAIVPDFKRHLLTMENDAAHSIVGTDLSATIETGYWSSSTGEAMTSDSWRRFANVQIEPNFKLHIKHGGDRHDAVFLDINGVKNGYVNGKAIADGFYEYQIPAGSYHLRLNVSSDGATYDALNDVPVIKYVAPEVLPFTQDQLNVGLSLTLPIV